MPSDTTDVEVVIQAPERKQVPPARVAFAEDHSDNSVTSLYDADFSGAGSLLLQAPSPIVSQGAGDIGELVARVARQLLPDLTAGGHSSAGLLLSAQIGW